MNLYRYSDAEIKQILKTMIILCDTREQENQHIKDYLDKHKISHQDTALNTGDCGGFKEDCYIVDYSNTNTPKKGFKQENKTISPKNKEEDKKKYLALEKDKELLKITKDNAKRDKGNIKKYVFNMIYYHVRNVLAAKGTRAL